FFMFYNY
ncbi:putative membrane protein, partial [Escherichia coli CB7326]